MKIEPHTYLTYLIGGAPYTESDLDLIRCEKGHLVAVDGGANALPADLIPDIIIGDLDSLNNQERLATQTRLVQVDDQNSTDLEKAIRYCLDHKFPQPFVCIGFIGGRFDQTLTTLHTSCLFPTLALVFVAEGLKYPLKDLKMHQGKLVGTSNEAIELVVSIHLKEGQCFLITERETYPHILKGLLDA